MAFPATDPTTPSVLPTGADLAAPDAEDLQHQMGLARGFAGLGVDGGWTVLPRITAEESFSDNIYAVQSPRQWDLTTIVTPGIAVLGDTSRVQLRLNYAPSLEMHIEAGDQNVLAQQFNGVATVTLVPDAVFVDIRGLAGVQAANGGLGGVGGLGQGTGQVTATSTAPNGELGLSKQDRAATASFSLSPYVLHDFSDIGVAKVGVSFTRSSTAELTGFAPIPFVSPGTGGQATTGLEEYGRFQTGDEFSNIRDTVSLDAQQSTSSGIGINSENRETGSNRLDYEINSKVTVYGQLGWEDITYSGPNSLHINGLTWGVGTVLTPNADSQLTLGYGYQDGGTAFSFSGHYAITARTNLTGSFTNGVGTQLEQISNQLNQAGVADDGSLENSQTGGALFTGNNALGVAGGIFRFNYLTFGATTVLDRDTISAHIGHSEQTAIGTNATAGSNAVWTGSVMWMRQFTADFSGTASAFYSVGTPVAGEHLNSLVVSLGVQYVLSESVSTFARYSFYNRQSNLAGESMYEDIVLVGITKQF